ncbi:MAG: SAM-dependent methyltransferase [Blastocatellia bacterium]|nr:SAM-dependent methyltransferase [Blastocatellia bacterium]
MIEVAPYTTVLAEQLRERIKREGPITFREWMRAALYDEAEGYYRRPHQIWGREGDYRTSPERSGLFAATFARYFAGLYQRLDNPRSLTLVEMGGGAGHFAFGVLQTLQAYFPQVFAATRYVFDEISITAQTAAQQRLLQFSGCVEFASVTDIEIDPGIVFSNELLDAFPVHRLTLLAGTLCEYYVTLGSDEQFAWMIGPASTPEVAEYLHRHDLRLREGQVAEVSLEMEAWLAKVATKLRRGYLVTVDYGAEAAELYSSAERERGTLRSFHRHAFVENLLAAPGDSDLTSTINWTAVRSAGESLGLETVQFARQDKFLLAAGLLDQLQLETANVNESDRLRLSTAAREMLLPNGMAANFQVLVQEKLSAANDLGTGGE